MQSGLKAQAVGSGEVVYLLKYIYTLYYQYILFYVFYLPIKGV